MTRLWPFTDRAKKTWLGKKYLVKKLQDTSGIEMLMHFQDKLIAQQFENLHAGKLERVDLLQTCLMRG